MIKSTILCICICSNTKKNIDFFFKNNVINGLSKFDIKKNLVYINLFIRNTINMVKGIFKTL